MCIRDRAYTASGGFPPFQGVPPQNPTGGPQNGPASPQGPFQSPFGAAPFFLDPMGGVNPNDQIDGAPVNDIAKLVQTNTAYYLPTFFNLRRYRRNRFNFCAFLCSGGWMLYRKQYKTGAIVTASMPVSYTHLDVYKRQSQHRGKYCRHQGNNQGVFQGIRCV